MTYRVGCLLNHVKAGNKSEHGLLAVGLEIVGKEFCYLLAGGALRAIRPACCTTHVSRFLPNTLSIFAAMSGGPRDHP